MLPIKKFIFLSLFFISISIFYIQSNKKKINKKAILCTTSIIYDALLELIKNDLPVEYLMGPSIDPHLYKPRSHDIYKLESASIIVFNGLHLEGKMADILEQLVHSGKKVINMSTPLNKSDLRETEYSGIFDPHVWFDVSLWKKSISYLAEELSKEFPELKNVINKRLEEYITKLDSLDVWVMEKINSIPLSKRILVTAHDAFGYFGKRYNIKVEGLQGISTDGEIRIEDIERIANIIISHNLPSIFIEETIPETYLDGMQQIITKNKKSVSIGGMLYSDALGELGSKGDTYIKMVEHNVQTIVNGLLKK